MAKKVFEKGDGRTIEYDPDFQGPSKNRSCTDVICLLIFVAFIAGWVGVGIWALQNGEPNTLLAPRDSSGLRCGIDDEVKDMPYLFFFDITKCFSASTLFSGCQTTQVCVSSCPTSIYVSSQNDTSNALPFCTYDYRTEYDSNQCPTYFLPSENPQLTLKRCLPSISSVSTSTLEDIAAIVQNSGDFVSTLNRSINNVQVLSQIEQIGKDAVDDLVNSWWHILIGSVGAIFVCLIYILIMRWVAGVMVWISIIGGVLALTAASYFSGREWQYWKDEYEYSGSGKIKRDILLGIFIVCLIVLTIVVLVVIVLRKRIQLAVALIKESSRAVSSVTSVLFFPIFPWILQIGVCAYVVAVGLFLASTGTPLYQYRNLTEACRQESGWTVSTACNKTTLTEDKARYTNCSEAVCLLTGISNESAYPYLQAYNIFCFFWLICFVSALGQMVMAQVFSQWYWTMKKSSLPFFALTAAFYRTLRYHIGTLAFGSLLIAICKMIRLCIEYIDHKLKKYDNELTKAILCCMKCFFWCLEKFLKFLNKNAYIMCAVHGKNFCASAKDAFMLLLRNIVRVVVVDKVTDFVFFLSKLLVAAGVGAIAYIIFCTDLVMDVTYLNYGYVPMVVLMILTYLVATLFFSVYSMAVDTLFLCFLEDLERNNGKDKPFYMSRNLMKILGKRNVGAKVE